MLERKERCVGHNGSHITMKSTQAVLKMDLTSGIKFYPPPLPHTPSDQGSHPRLSLLQIGFVV